MTKFPKSGSTGKWEGIGDLIEMIYDVLTFDYGQETEDLSEYTRKMVDRLWNEIDRDQISAIVIDCCNYSVDGPYHKEETQMKKYKLWFDIIFIDGSEEVTYHHKGEMGFRNWAFTGFDYTKDGAWVTFPKLPPPYDPYDSDGGMYGG